ncbi:MAG: MotA/TolQ/ExbB proton channel family protein [Planctomycetota bacterium]|nr:MotA/TolQ/ExbB proton channel family protein [Planctomycetota bacterium]
MDSAEHLHAVEAPQIIETTERMYFKYDCPKCQKSLKLSEQHVGKKIKCPFCQSTVDVTSAAVQSAAPASPSVPQIDTGEASSSPAVSRAKASSAPRQQPIYEMATSTEVAWWVTASVAFGSAGIFLLILVPLRQTYFGALFLDRGWVPFAMTILLFWACAILVFKWLKMLEQKSAMLVDVLPADVAEEISLGNLEAFAKGVHKLPAKQKKSFLVNRVLRGLEHYRVRKNAGEVSGLLQSQSEIDANNVDSSYTLLKVFVWAIPILGFIGTVIGISAAVGSFSGSLQDSSDISKLKESLNDVTAGLSTAFDTTLVALVMSLIIKFPMSAMQKSENGLLNWVDEYCNENLIKRLKDETVSEFDNALPPEIKQALEHTVGQHTAAMNTWNEKLSTIGETLTSQVQKELHDVNVEMIRQQAEVTKMIGSNLQSIQSGLGSLANLLEKLDGKQVVVEQTKKGWFG